MMSKLSFRHCDKREGKPRAPISMRQLAKEGRLEPSAVAAMVRDGRLDAKTIAELRAARTYPKRFLTRSGGADQIVAKVPIRWRRGGAVMKTLRLYRWTF